MKKKTAIRNAMTGIPEGGKTDNPKVDERTVFR
jgi:hypothetical protein